MRTLNDIQKPIKLQLEEFESLFRDSLRSEERSVDEVIRYVYKMGGKKMRPTFVLLCASLFGEINRKSYISALLIELTHTASLVHDDVLDESIYRRNMWSVNALWRSKRSILIGDYILSHGINIASKNGYYDIIEEVSGTMQDMTKGEIMQSESSDDFNISEQRYFEVIRYKTAVLLAACAKLGARSVGADDKDVERITEFGNLLGLAFQIKDDILDYNATSLIGKPYGNDIRERKMTLPLILALKNVSKDEQRQILRLLRRADIKEGNVEKVHDFVVSKGGIDASTNKMNEIKCKAISILDGYADSEFKRALVEFANFILERKK